MAKDETKSVAPTRRGPLSVFPNLDLEIERVLGGRLPRFFDWPTARADLDAELPSVDVVDHEDHIVVRAEVPGYSKDEVDVSVEGHSVTIRATSKAETQNDGQGRYHRREITTGYLARTVGLPAEVNGEEAKAKLVDGVLEITVPKLEKTKRRKVEIEA